MTSLLLLNSTLFEAWTLNQKDAADKIPHLQISFDYQNEYFELPDELNRTTAIAAFKSYYGDFLEFVKQRFGVELTVDYGALVYCF